MLINIPMKLIEINMIPITLFLDSLQIFYFLVKCLFKLFYNVFNIFPLYKRLNALRLNSLITNLNFLIYLKLFYTIFRLFGFVYILSVFCKTILPAFFNKNKFTWISLQNLSFLNILIFRKKKVSFWSNMMYLSILSCSSTNIV